MLLLNKIEQVQHIYSGITNSNILSDMENLILLTL